MKDITQPHNKFFKLVFSRGVTTAEFIENNLPPDIVSLIDLESLEYEKDTFIDERFKDHFSDLLIKMKLANGKTGYLYILIEHKSYQDPIAAFQILKYKVFTWDMLEKRKELIRFPVILPVLLYHGREKWRAGLNFKDLVDYPEAMEPYVPDFNYILWDASQYTDEEIKGGIILRTALLTFKYIFHKNLRDRLPGIFGLMRELANKRTGIEYIEEVIKYILNAAPEGNINYEDVSSAVEQSFSEKGGDLMRTVADTLIEKGEERGVEKGVLKNFNEVIADILDIRFNSVPQAITEKLRKIKDPSKLRILHMDAVKAESIDEFTGIVEKSLQECT